jgi:hypothetical protein
MNVMEVIKQPTRVDQLIAIAVGSEKLVPYSQASSFRTAISRDVKDTYPDAEFETKVVSIETGKKKVKYLGVKRIK